MSGKFLPPNVRFFWFILDPQTYPQTFCTLEGTIVPWKVQHEINRWGHHEGTHYPRISAYETISMPFISPRMTAHIYTVWTVYIWACSPHGTEGMHSS